MRTPEKGNPSRSVTLAGGEQRGASNAEARLDLAKSVALACSPEADLTARPGRGLKASASLGEQASPDAAGTFQAAHAAGRPAPAGLPCLSSNNSIPALLRNAPDQLVPKALSQQHKKSASALAWNIQFLAERYGIHRLGFFTLTTPDGVCCPKAFSKRFNSLATNVMRDRYVDWIRISERHKSGAVHYHFVVVLPEGIDIRTGCDFVAFANRDYSSAPRALKREWSFWRRIAPRYGFGRHELLPVKSTAEGIGRYVGKYLSKTVHMRSPLDHGARLVEYTRGARMANTKFAWATPGAAIWRAKVGVFARIVSVQTGCADALELLGEPPFDFSDLSAVLGDRWAYRHREFIASLPEE